MSNLFELPDGEGYINLDFISDIMPLGGEVGDNQGMWAVCQPGQSSLSDYYVEVDEACKDAIVARMGGGRFVSEDEYETQLARGDAYESVINEMSIRMVAATYPPMEGGPLELLSNILARLQQADHARELIGRARRIDNIPTILPSEYEAIDRWVRGDD